MKLKRENRGNNVLETSEYLGIRNLWIFESIFQSKRTFRVSWKHNYTRIT